MSSGDDNFLTSDRADQAKVIANYEEEMKRRGGEEARLSAQNTEMVHDWNLVLQSPLFQAGMTKVEA